MTRKCYGKRAKAWDKCEECEDILACSIITLETVLGDKVEIIA